MVWEANDGRTLKIESWGKGETLEREIALVDDIVVARAAYEAALTVWPGAWITRRHGARVIRENKPGS